jgi:hypothetical protein
MHLSSAEHGRLTIHDNVSVTIVTLSVPLIVTLS